MTHQIAKTWEFFKTALALRWIDTMSGLLMIIVVDQLTKLFITQITIVEDAVRLVPLQARTSRKFLLAPGTVRTAGLFTLMHLQSLNSVEYFIAALALILRFLRSLIHLEITNSLFSQF